MHITGSKSLADIVEFIADLYEISYFKLKVSHTNEHSECIRNIDGSFEILVEKDLEEEQTVKHIAHEMQHLKQFKHDRLFQTEAGMTVFDGVEYPPSEYMSDEYFLTPWEMEARAYEDFVLYKWDNRK